MIWSAFLAYVKLPGCKTHKQKVRIQIITELTGPMFLTTSTEGTEELWNSIAKGSLGRPGLSFVQGESTKSNWILRVVHDIMKQKATKSNQNVEIKYSKQYQRIQIVRRPLH